MAGQSVRGRWRPQVEGEGLRLTLAARDCYVVVDDIEAGRAVLVSSPWPEVDDLGHLVFGDQATSLDLPLGELQAAVDRQRQAAGQPAPDRPVRVGDVFWVRPPASKAGAGDPDRWRILDVTRAARRCAHAALLVAANPALRSDQPPPPVETDQPEAAEPPPTGAAQAAV